VAVLTASTDGVLRLLRVRRVARPGITPEEIRVLLQQGTEEGVFEESEQEMVTNVLSLDDTHVDAILTPRSDVAFLDIREPADRVREMLRRVPHAVLPVCDGGLDHVIGFARSTRIMEHLIEHRSADVRGVTEPALFVPEAMSLMTLLEQFKRTHLPVALVVDEFGEVEGLVSLTDVISSIVGDLPTEPGEEPAILRREDGSWLIDGSLDLAKVAEALEATSLVAADERQHYHTLGGLAMQSLGRVPRTGDVFERGGHRFEIVDMDGNRVDRVLVARVPGPE
jgi:putative hemolysin